MSERSLNVLFTHAQRKVLAELVPKLADKLVLDAAKHRTVSFTVEELKAIQEKARTAIPHAENGLRRNSLRHIIEITGKAIKQARGIGAITPSERLYQFKITLLGIKPPIWRRIQVKDGTLDKLHEHIQTAMGWTNSHLHQFKINGERFGDPQLLDDGFDGFEHIDSTITKLSEIVPEDGSRFCFRYEYDFGDGWEHEILFEGCVRAEPNGRYPLCLEGARACPPEDVGGVGGYEEFLEALADPKHEQHEDFVQWSGRGYYPESFDPIQATKHMKRGLPNWRQHQ
jgi:Plasmid pRiA4b ORF-3-like protein